MEAEEVRVRRRHSLPKVLGLYLAMPFLEFYARSSGIYTPRFANGHGPWTNFPLKNTGPVICFGDSLTAGYGASKLACYPELLNSRWANRGIHVINSGINGDTASDGLDRLQNVLEALPESPRCVIIGFGGNDLLQRIPVSETFANLGSIIDQVHATGAGVVLIGLRGSWLYKIDYEVPFYQLSQIKKCPLVPLCLDHIWGNPFLMHDPAHPNQRGYKKLADKIAAVVEPVLF